MSINLQFKKRCNFRKKVYLHGSFSDCTYFQYFTNVQLMKFVIIKDNTKLKTQP